MWAQYRSRFLATQIFVGMMCAIGYWVMKSPPGVVMVAFAMMELAAVFGAWYGTRGKKY